MIPQVQLLLNRISDEVRSLRPILRISYRKILDKNVLAPSVDAFCEQQALYRNRIGPSISVGDSTSTDSLPI